jgi:hypothetical protein
MERMGQRQSDLSTADIQSKVANMGMVTSGDKQVNLGDVAGMDRMQYQDFMSKLDPNILRKIRQEQLGLYGFNPFAKR